MNKQKLLDLVVEVCNTVPEAANNDVILLEQIWLRQGWNENRSLYDNLSKVSRSESITRRRREAYNKGLIQYSQKSLEERTDAFKNERDHNSSYSAVSWLKD